MKYTVKDSEEMEKIIEILQDHGIETTNNKDFYNCEFNEITNRVELTVVNCFLKSYCYPIKWNFQKLYFRERKEQKNNYDVFLIFEKIRIKLDNVDILNFCLENYQKLY